MASMSTLRWAPPTNVRTSAIPSTREPRPMGVARFLDLAPKAAAALAEIHARGVIHRNITPENILVDPAGPAVSLADFRLATELAEEQAPPRPVRRIEGNLVYLSPERTGRVNRPVDARSDLYSLGVCFYEWLTGRPPFAAEDPLELIHSHIARTPEPPAEARPEIPRTISRLVQRLLAKRPEDRYQTAIGVQRDLERCLAITGHAASDEGFVLGQDDRSSVLRVPHKLYGREADLAILNAAFERIASGGRAEVVLVTGYSGIGKTTFVNELHRPLVRERGTFVAGKVDQAQRGIPYAVIRQVITQLVRQVLSGSEAELSAQRAQILDALGDAARVVIDVAPALELLIGPRPPVPPLPPTESRYRLRRLVRRFLGVFTAAERPLVVFLDDLQWSDVATLELIQGFVADPEMRHLLLIIAYRDNEVTPTHPLMLTVEEIDRAGVPQGRIVLQPLGLAHIRELIGEALIASSEQVAELAELLAELTAGNPFFLGQLLLAIHREGLVTFSAGDGAWRWDLEAIRRRGFTSNVVDLMAAKLKTLPAETQRALTVMACASGRMETDKLTVILDRREEEVHEALWTALREGLLVHGSDVYQFRHDRIQQATYGLVDAAERRAIHARIGHLLLGATTDETLAEHAFDIAHQLNQAELVDREELVRAARVNLVAGRRAKVSGAHKAAADYFAVGIAQLPKDAWEGLYELTRDLYLSCSECDHASGNLERADALCAKLVERARTPLDRASALCVLMRVDTTRGKFDRAIETGIAALRFFDIDLPARPSPERVSSELEALLERFRDRPVEELVNLPAMTDPSKLAAVEIFDALTLPAIFANGAFYSLCLTRAVNAFLDHGNADIAAWIYASFSWVLVFSRVGKYRDADRFGRLGYELMEARRLYASKAKIALFHGDLVAPWVRPFRDGLPVLRDGFKAGLEYGDLLYCCYICNHTITLLLTTGTPLDEVYRESVRRLDFVERAKDPNVRDIIVSQQRFIQCLRGHTASLATFSDANFDQRAFEGHLEESQMVMMVCWYYILKTQARFIAGELDEARAAAAQARARAVSTDGTPFQLPDYHFQSAMVAAATWDTASPGERTALREELGEHERLFRVWSESCAENFGDRHAIIEAEIARIEGRAAEACRHYERAIAAARDTGFVHNEALAHERYAALYRGEGLEAAALGCLHEARRCYAAWGAFGKVAELERRDDRLRADAAGASPVTRIEQLDALSLMKASQAISAEISFERLLGTLLRIMMENAGAQSGALLRPSGDGLSVVARDRAVSAGEAAAAPPDEDLPLSLLDYVRRTRERVVLADAASESPFASDPYVAERRPRSVLCMPLARRDHFIAVLYLEHRTVTGLFTEERASALDLLAAQAVISLENAALYDDLEQRIRERTRELEEAHRQLVTIARRAGMAEIASGVLHNVGNSLVTVTLAAGLAAERVARYPVAQVRRSAGLLTANRERLSEFLASDPRGKILPDYLDRLGESLERERVEIGADLKALMSNLEQVKAVLRAQQAYVEAPRLVERVSVADLVDDALRMQIAGLERHGVVVRRQIDASPTMLLERHKVLQILANLISNAKQALVGSATQPKLLTIEVQAPAPDRLVITVADNGAGISAANMARLFQQGFTTRGDGHGYGLHWAGNATKEMRGSLQASSEGPGLGAVFRLELPAANAEVGEA